MHWEGDKRSFLARCPCFTQFFPLWGLERLGIWISLWLGWLKEGDFCAWVLFWTMETCLQQTPSAFLGKLGHLCWVTQPSTGAKSVTVQPTGWLCWGNNDLKKLTLQLSSVSADRSLLLLSCVCFQALEIIIPAFSTVAGNLKLGKVSRQADQNLKI